MMDIIRSSEAKSVQVHFGRQYTLSRQPLIAAVENKKTMWLIPWSSTFIKLYENLPPDRTIQNDKKN